MKKKILIAAVALIVLAMIGGYFIFDSIFPKAKPINTPAKEQILSVSLACSDGGTAAVTETDFEMLLQHLNDAQPTRQMCVNDYPTAKTYYTIEIDTTDRVYRYYLYEDNSRVYIEVPYEGIYQSGAEMLQFGQRAGNSSNSPDQGMEPEAYAFEAQYIRTNGYSEDRSYPYHVVISSREELAAYYEANKEQFDLERKEVVYSDTTIGFLDACDKYDDTYFERQNLVMIILEEGSGSIRHDITDVRRHRDENGALFGWDITINRIVPEAGTDDMAQWHLLLEVQMGDVIKSDDNVWLNGKLSSSCEDK